jgi:hypothetical protein
MVPLRSSSTIRIMAGGEMMRVRGDSEYTSAPLGDGMYPADAKYPTDAHIQRMTNG